MARGLRLVHPKLASARILESVMQILDHTPLCSIATVGSKGAPHINTAFFAVDRKTLVLFFLSDPGTLHGANLRANRRAALTIFDSRQKWGESLGGAQLFGRAEIAKDSSAASALYGERFPAYKEWFESLDSAARQAFDSRFYCFVPERLKVLDERRFGEETFVDCAIERQ